MESVERRGMSWRFEQFAVESLLTPTIISEGLDEKEKAEHIGRQIILDRLYRCLDEPFEVSTSSDSCQK